MKHRLISFLLVGCVWASACGSSAVSPVGVQGTYVLRSIDGQSLPVAVPQANPAAAITSGSLRISGIDSVQLRQEMTTAATNGGPSSVAETSASGRIVVSGSSCVLVITQPVVANDTCVVVAGQITVAYDTGRGIESRVYSAQ